MDGDYVEHWALGVTRRDHRTWICDDSFRVDEYGKPAPQGCERLRIVSRYDGLCWLCRRAVGKAQLT